MRLHYYIDPPSLSTICLSNLIVVPTYGNSRGIGAPSFRAIATVNSGRFKRIDGSGARVKGNEFEKTLIPFFASRYHIKG